MRRDVPTCRPEEPVGVARERARAAGWDTVLATNERGVVAGRLRGSRLAEAGGDATVESLMERAPKTIRPDVFLHDIVAQMQRAGAVQWLVTDYGTRDGGVLLGALLRSDVERVVAENEPD